MRRPCSMDMMIEKYFNAMTTSQYTLASLSNLLDDAEIIRLCLVQIIKNDDLIESCEKWEDQLANAETWAEFSYVHDQTGHQS